MSATLQAEHVGTQVSIEPGTASTGTQTLAAAQTLLYLPLSVSLLVRDRQRGPRGGGQDSSCESHFLFELKILTCLWSSIFLVPPDFLWRFLVFQ